MMLEQEKNIVINQGASFSMDFQILDEDGETAADLTGCTAIAKARRAWSEPGYVEFVADIIDPQNGIVNLFLSETDTADMFAVKWVYDIIIDRPQMSSSSFAGGGDKIRVFKGWANVSPGVSQ